MAASKTRDRILEAALRLFNDEGLPAVSTHRIAAELGISPGNLHYHFKTKRLIVAWLFRRYEDRLEPCLAAAASATALDDLWLSLHLTFEAISEYRFIGRDMDHLLNESPELEARAQALTARQLLAAQSLCAGLAQRGRDRRVGRGRRDARAADRLRDHVLVLVHPPDAGAPRLRRTAMPRSPRTTR